MTRDEMILKLVKADMATIQMPEDKQAEFIPAVIANGNHPYANSTDDELALMCLGFEVPKAAA